MPRLPKFNELGHMHFITTKVWRNIWIFRDEKYCDILIENIEFYRKKFSFKFIGYVIMPWHVHLILQLSEKHNEIETVMQQLKSMVAREIIDDLKVSNPQLLDRLRVKPEPLLGFASSRSRPARLAPTQVGAGGGSDLPTRKSYKKPSYHLWWEDFYDFNIYSYEKLEEKLDYIHTNPVKAGFVIDPIDWRYSSARNYYLGDHSLIKIDEIDL